MRGSHHAVGVGVAGLRDRQALDHLWGHPGEGAHQGHVCGVGHEPGRPEVTDLRRPTQRNVRLEGTVNAAFPSKLCHSEC